MQPETPNPTPHPRSQIQVPRSLASDKAHEASPRTTALQRAPHPGRNCSVRVLAFRKHECLPRGLRLTITLGGIKVESRFRKLPFWRTSNTRLQLAKHLVLGDLQSLKARSSCMHIQPKNQSDIKTKSPAKTCGLIYFDRSLINV